MVSLKPPTGGFLFSCIFKNTVPSWLHSRPQAAQKSTAVGQSRFRQTVMRVNYDNSIER
jgi:hypothetical protein